MSCPCNRSRRESTGTARTDFFGLARDAVRGAWGTGTGAGVSTLFSANVLRRLPRSCICNFACRGLSAFLIKGSHVAPLRRPKAQCSCGGQTAAAHEQRHCRDSAMPAFNNLVTLMFHGAPISSTLTASVKPRCWALRSSAYSPTYRSRTHDCENAKVLQ